MGQPFRCKGKVRHADKTGVVIALKKVGNAGLSAYPCPQCKGWHLGGSSNPLKRANRIGQLLDRHRRKMEVRA